MALSSWPACCLQVVCWLLTMLMQGQQLICKRFAKPVDKRVPDDSSAREWERRQKNNRDTIGKHSDVFLSSRLCEHQQLVSSKVPLSDSFYLWQSDILDIDRNWTYCYYALNINLTFVHMVARWLQKVMWINWTFEYYKSVSPFCVLNNLVSKTRS